MNDDSRSKIAYITAGAAGMYCGSCIHDNTLASALLTKDVDIALIPTYTPIRTDEHDVSLDHVFFGGINVYLQQRIPLFRYLPAFLDRLIDRPSVIRWLASGDIETRPEHLGDLTLSMLRGEAGFQAKEVHKLTRWLKDDYRPDLINLSNLLIAGCVPHLKEELNVPVIITLQGDDIFLESLPESYRNQAIKLAQDLVEHVDGFIVFSQFYGEFMRDYFQIPEEKLFQVPLGINTQGFAEVERAKETKRAIGYLARLAPEKGLHLLVDAFLKLREESEFEDVQLRIAGWLGKQNDAYVKEQFQRLDAAGLRDDYQYFGTVDREEKLDFLRQLDLLSVPTTYHEPKGLFVLEAMAAGVPVVQPHHGAFPEILSNTGGGLLCKPDDTHELAQQLGNLLRDEEQRQQHRRQGRQALTERFDASTMADQTIDVYRRFIKID